MLGVERELDPAGAGSEVAGELVAGVDGRRRVAELVDDDVAAVGIGRQDDLVDGPRRGRRAERDSAGRNGRSRILRAGG